MVGLSRRGEMPDRGQLCRDRSQASPLPGLGDLRDRRRAAASLPHVAKVPSERSESKCANQPNPVERSESTLQPSVRILNQYCSLECPKSFCNTICQKRTFDRAVDAIERRAV